MTRAFEAAVAQREAATAADAVYEASSGDSSGVIKKGATPAAASDDSVGNSGAMKGGDD